MQEITGGTIPCSCCGGESTAGEPGVKEGGREQLLLRLWIDGRGMPEMRVSKYLSQQIGVKVLTQLECSACSYDWLTEVVLFHCDHHAIGYMLGMLEDECASCNHPTDPYSILDDLASHYMARESMFGGPF